MTNDNLIKLHIWFDEFIKNCTSNKKEIQDAIDRKKEHTDRVCNNVKLIGQSIGLNKNDLNIAEIIALFHDIGRFVQYSKYRTFLDSKKDHAEISTMTMSKLDILKVLSEEEKNIIIKAIKYHNAFDIPKEEDERVLLFSKLIRDADKLDLYEIHVNYFEEKSENHKPILEKYPDIEEYSMQIIDDILNNRCIKKSDIKTYNDLKLTYVSWIFDVNYDFTISQIIKNHYIERLVRILPDTNDINRIYSHVNSYINKTLKHLQLTKNA